MIEKELLTKFCLSIVDVAKLLDIDRRKAKVISDEIRINNIKYYSQGLHGKTGINPIHLAPFLGLTKSEMIGIIYVEKQSKK